MVSTPNPLFTLHSTGIVSFLLDLLALEAHRSYASINNNHTCGKCNPVMLQYQGPNSSHMPISSALLPRLDLHVLYTASIAAFCMSLLQTSGYKVHLGHHPRVLGSMHAESLFV